MEVSRLLLDTSAYSALGRGHAGIAELLQSADEVWMSPIVLGELHAGFRRGARRIENERNLARFLAAPRISIADVALETAHRYAEILDYLRKAGTPVPTNDVWIAASAMQNGLMLVTTDAHYERIPHVLVRKFRSGE